MPQRSNHAAQPCIETGNRVHQHKTGHLYFVFGQGSFRYLPGPYLDEYGPSTPQDRPIKFDTHDRKTPDDFSCCLPAMPLVSPQTRTRLHHPRCLSVSTLPRPWHVTRCPPHPPPPPQVHVTRTNSKCRLSPGHLRNEEDADCVWIAELFRNWRRQCLFKPIMCMQTAFL